MWPFAPKKPGKGRKRCPDCQGRGWKLKQFVQVEAGEVYRFIDEWRPCQVCETAGSLRVIRIGAEHAAWDEAPWVPKRGTPR